MSEKTVYDENGLYTSNIIISLETNQKSVNISIKTNEKANRHEVDGAVENARYALERMRDEILSMGLEPSPLPFEVKNTGRQVVKRKDDD
jgi:hypothetical protein